MLVPMKGVARRIVLEVVGWSLLVAGVAALVLPGPGLLMMFAGLAVLSQQYEWAERRLAPIQYRALKGAAESVETKLRVVFSLLGVVWLVAMAVLWFRKPAQPGWWSDLGLPDGLWLPGGTATAITLAASAAIALGLVVYSYRRFHGKPEAVAELERDIVAADAAAHQH